MRHAVERQAPLVTIFKIGLIGQNRPQMLGSLAPLESGLEFYFEMHHERVGDL